MQFFSASATRLSDKLLLLPQKDAPVGPGGRPRNAYALVSATRSILVDAAFSWCFDAVKAVADRGHPPVALVLTSRDVAAEGDAFDRIERVFGVPVLLHPGEGPPVRLPGGATLSDPRDDPFAKRAGLVAHHLPSTEPWATVYRWEEDGGVLVAGETVLGAAPGDEDEDRLSLPEGAAGVPLVSALSAILDATPARSLLPAFGRPLVDVPDLATRIDALARGA